MVSIAYYRFNSIEKKGHENSKIEWEKGKIVAEKCVRVKIA